MKIRQVLAAALALSGAVSAQSAFVYAFNQQGQVSANAYPLDNLPDSTSSTSNEIWQSLFIHGADRWLIRGDGKVAENGKIVFSLSNDVLWRGIVVDDTDAFFGMSKGGRVSGVNGIVVDYGAGSFEFTDIRTDGTTVYVLKSNGAVFRVPEPDPIVKFDGPPGEVSGSTADGQALDVLWERLAINPVDGKLWGLRHDGIIQSADIPVDPPATPNPGVAEAALPYDNGDGFVDPDQLYADFAFDADATWYALRADGRLFSVAAQGPPLVDLPGEPSDNADQTYESLLVKGGQTVALRSDGKVYRNVDTTAIVDLKNNSYVGLAFGVVLPDLTNVKNQPPVGSSMKVVAPEGADVELPVIATDRDLATADLVVDIVADTLPAGATWDGPTRTISWPAAGPVGTYKVKVTVSDGIAKPVTAVQTITIKPLDANPAKNIKPSIAKVSKAIALVGLPFTLPVLAFDQDGDTLDVSLDDTGTPPPAGVAFDDVTWVLTWDNPNIAATGSVPFKFIADDGTAQAKRTLKVKVQSSLLAF